MHSRFRFFGFVALDLWNGLRRQMRGRGFPSAFRPDSRAELAKCSARPSRVEWPAERSNRYGGQMGRAKKDNQVCLAHLIRDVQYANDTGDGMFAPGLHLASASTN
jgi:hypothetical protein